MKKILHLEDDQKPDTDLALGRWIKNQNAEVKFIGNAYNSGEEIAKVINWCDCLAFSSTFHYLSKIQNLLTKVIIPLRKEPLKIVIEGYEVAESINELVEDLAKEWVTQGYDEEDGITFGQYELNEQKADSFCYSIRHFELFEVTFDSKLKRINILHDRITRETERLLFEKEYKASAINRLTGRKIKICDLSSVHGPEWSKLESGSIVDEVDMSKLDPQPGYGIWVMGLTEPVKLLNRYDYYQYNEYEILK